MEKRTLLIYLSFIFLIIFDTVTKAYFLNKQIILLKNILEITPVKNTGIAFGLFKGNTFFTIILPVVAIILLVYFFYKRKQNIAKIGLALTISGLIGNLISRLTYGYVPDFITIPFLSFIFQTFNFADLFSFVGIVLLIIFLLKEK